MTKRTIVALLLIALVSTLVACGGGDDGTTNGSDTNGESVAPGDPGSGETPAADGATLLEERCTGCHTTSRILGASKDVEGWKSTITRMVDKGAELTPEEQAVLAEYLAGL